MPVPFRTVLCSAALVLALPASGFAQLQSAGSVGAPSANAQVKAKPREKAPPALPGARAEPDAVAPPSRNAPDLPPTEALFDAINRGDLPMAKDAINRGADINGRNVLGLSPLELSVDLGRNQISFLLLSLRGSAGFSTTGGPPPASTASRGPTRAERLAAARAERQERLEAARAERASRTAAVAEPAPATPQAPRLFSGGGGAPIPQAGFLGFDSGR